MRGYRFTVFTATYNRAGCIGRVFDSLAAQTCRDFEWLVVDDGSTDGTAEVVEGLRLKAPFPVRYIRKRHAGKAAAWNMGVGEARGELFVCADSDDAFLPCALERLLAMWETVPTDERGRFRGVSCRCLDEGGSLVGDRDFPEPYLDATSPDVALRLGMNYEMWGANRTEVLREYPMPVVEGHAFFPEAIVWDRMSERYVSRFFNEPLRVIFDDQANKATSKSANTRFRENYLLWGHYLNEMGAYFRYSPRLYCKAAVGMVRDGILGGMTWGGVLKDIEEPRFKLLAVLGTPVARYLLKRGR